MNREEVLAMRAGVDLDKLVCGEILEWKTFGSLKHYSTDLLAAWEIVDGIGIKSFKLIRDLDGMWSAKFRFGSRGWAIAKTAQEAICKAALLTKVEG